MTNVEFQRPSQKFPLAERSILVGGLAGLAGLVLAITLGCQKSGSDQEIGELKSHLAQVEANHAKELNAKLALLKYEFASSLERFAAQNLKDLGEKKGGISKEDLDKEIAKLKAEQKRIDQEIEKQKVKVPPTPPAAPPGQDKKPDDSKPKEDKPKEDKPPGPGPANPTPPPGSEEGDSDAQKALKVLAGLAALAGFPGLAAVIAALAGLDLGLSDGDMLAMGSALTNAVVAGPDGKLKIDEGKFADALSKLPTKVLREKGDKFVDEFKNELGDKVTGKLKKVLAEIKSIEGEFEKLKGAIKDKDAFHRLVDAAKKEGQTRIDGLNEWLAQNAKGGTAEQKQLLRTFLKEKLSVSDDDLKKVGL